MKTNAASLRQDLIAKGLVKPSDNNCVVRTVKNPTSCLNAILARRAELQRYSQKVWK